MNHIKRLIIPSVSDILDHGAHVFHTGFAGADAESGAAPAGFHQRSDAIELVPGSRTTTIDGQPVNEIWNEFQARVSAFNAVADAQTALITFPVLQATEKVAVPTNPGMQQATEFGRPEKIRTKLVTRGFPIEHYDLGAGFTQEFLDEATSAQITAVALQAEMAYSLLRQEISLEALFTSANSTDEDGVNVKRLYNNDGEVPPKWKRWTHDGTHTHYLSSSAGAWAAADFDTLEEHLIHHGFGDNGVGLIVQAYRDDLAVIRALDEFVPAESADRPTITTGPIVGPTRGSTIPGFPAQGYVGPFTIVRNDLIPSGYLLAQAVAGSFSPRNPVGLRVHSNPSARGLRLFEGPYRYPLLESVYDCYLGAGVGQRGAAVVMEQGTDEYTDPTFDT